MKEVHIFTQIIKGDIKMDISERLIYIILSIRDKYRKADKETRINKTWGMCGTRFTEEEIRKAEVKYND